MKIKSNVKISFIVILKKYDHDLRYDNIFLFKNTLKPTHTHKSKLNRKLKRNHKKYITFILCVLDLEKIL